MEAKQYGLPAYKALEAIDNAEILFAFRKDKDAAHTYLYQALDMQVDVERFASPPDEQRNTMFLTESERKNHYIFTQALTRACALAWYMKDHALAERLYKQACAWANDPMCSSVEHYNEIILLWQRLTMPWWKRPFHVFYKLFSATGEYEIHKQHPGL